MRDRFYRTKAETYDAAPHIVDLQACRAPYLGGTYFSGPADSYTLNICEQMPYFTSL